MSVPERARPGLGLIWAQARGGVIGVDGGLPWHLPEDLAHFRETTAGSPVIMGRATWESLPARFRPLPGRPNIVLSRRPGFVADGATVVMNLAAALDAAALDAAALDAAGRDAWVIGGSSVYAEAIAHADRLEITEVDLEVAGDTHAPPIDSAWLEVTRAPATGWHTSTAGDRYRFVSYRRRSVPASA